MTIEDIKVEGIDIEAGIEVVIVEMARSIKVGASVGLHLHLTDVSDGAILHPPHYPKELPDAFVRLKARHVQVVPVCDVEYPPIPVHRRWARMTHRRTWRGVRRWPPI